MNEWVGWAFSKAPRKKKIRVRARAEIGVVHALMHKPLRGPGSAQSKRRLGREWEAQALGRACALLPREGSSGNFAKDAKVGVWRLVVIAGGGEVVSLQRGRERRLVRGGEVRLVR